MDEHDWNDDPPAAIPAWAPTEASGEAVDQLPEVTALVEQGWEVAPDSPAWSFLPAVWPQTHRTWVPDRATYTTLVYEGDSVRAEPLSPADKTEFDADYAQLCAMAGVPPRPTGRIWLLRAVGGWSPKRVCGEVIARLERSGSGFHPSLELTETVRQVLREAAAGPA